MLLLRLTSRSGQEYCVKSALARETGVKNHAPGRLSSLRRAIAQQSAGPSRYPVPDMPSIQGVQMSLPIQRAHLDGLVVFVAVAELRGFRAAARQLGVTPSAISQTIRALEQRVGAPLLSRTTRSVGLTEAGERLLVHARPAMEMLSLGLDAAASLGDDVSGRRRSKPPSPTSPVRR